MRAQGKMRRPGPQWSRDGGCWTTRETLTWYSSKAVFQESTIAELSHIPPASGPPSVAISIQSFILVGRAECSSQVCVARRQSCPKECRPLIGWTHMLETTPAAEETGAFSSLVFQAPRHRPNLSQDHVCLHV